MGVKLKSKTCWIQKCVGYNLPFYYDLAHSQSERCQNVLYFGNSAN